MANDARIHRIASPLPKLDGKDRLILESLRYEDELGMPFECVIRARSEDHSIDELKLLGESLTVQYEPGEETLRFFDGRVSEVNYLGISDRQSIYEITLRPWFWFLKHSIDSRIFQEKSVKDIFEVVCKDTHGFSDYRFHLEGKLSTRVYCVQYQESCFHFISRLLEEEGIYYYFEHERGKHTMVLTDVASSHKDIKGDRRVPFRLPGDAASELRHIDSWTSSTQLQSTKVEIDDFDFEKPMAGIEAKAQIRRQHKLSGFEQYVFPGRYSETSEGKRLAEIRGDQAQTNFRCFSGGGNHPALATGFKFQLIDYPRKDQNAAYFIKRMVIEIRSAEVEIFSGEDNDFRVQFEAMKVGSSKDPQTQFRTPARTPRPIVTGPQSAIVVGKKGEEIWTDKYGRVKVQFHWDREGKKDEDSSCWVRVSQLWAGRAWGAVHLPRIGQEVLVEFLDGDPDRPIITGRVYNANETTPYDLPDNQTQSGIKSRSSKKGNAKNFNELRFEDKLGEEEVYLHAERDFTQIVENDARIQIGCETKDKGDQTIEVHNDRSLTLNEGSESITIKKGSRTIKVEQGKETVEVFDDRSLTVKQGNETIQIKMGNREIDVATGKHTTKAAQAIELVVGASSIKIAPGKITISSPQIEIAGVAQTKVSAAITDLSATGMLKLSSPILKIN